MRFLPKSASSTFLMSLLTTAVDMLLLYGARKAAEKLEFDYL